MLPDANVSLKKVLRALVLVSLRGLDVDSQVETLLRAGFSNAETAALTGVTANAVALRKSRQKKRGSK